MKFLNSVDNIILKIFTNARNCRVFSATTKISYNQVWLMDFVLVNLSLDDKLREIPATEHNTMNGLGRAASRHLGNDAWITD